MAGSFKLALLLPAWLVLALAVPAAAQLKLGETSTNLSGVLSFGYAADYGSAISSDHTWELGGSASMSGSFYSPNFLTYNASVFLNQSRANSDYQSISNASGVTVNTSLFQGSRFPGTVSYSKTFDSEGNYAVPGLANYVTHGNNDAFGINWNVNLPHYPTLAAGFQKGGGEYSVYGTNDQGSNYYNSANVSSSYTWAGFGMGAFYDKGDGHSLLPDVVSGIEGAAAQTDNDAFGFNVSHTLPLRGSFGANFDRSGWNSTFEGNNSTGNLDLTNVRASIQPTVNLSASASLSYSDNLSGQLQEAILGAGGVLSQASSNESSDSLDFLAVAGYSPARNLLTNVSFERRSQHFDGQDYGVTSYGAGATYSHTLYNGMFGASFSFAENTTDQSGEDNLTFSANENYSNQLWGWRVQESAAYAQNQETLLVTYLNSNYSFSGSAARRWGHLAVSMGASLSRTALTDQAGTSSDSESYSGSAGYSPYLTLTGSYSRSNGEALLTGAGLVPVGSNPLPSSLVSLYGGDGFSLALASAPIKRLTLSASYARSNSNTTSSNVTASDPTGAPISSTNENDEYNALILYQVRKLYFTSGFSRLGQGFSSSGTAPETVSSFYVGISRWFNFF